MLYLLHVLLVGVVQKRQIFLKDGTSLCPWLNFTGLSFMACQFCHPIGELLYVEQLRIAGITCE